MLEAISSHYKVRKLTVKDVDQIYKLSSGNPIFYQYCPPFVTRESILQDLEALPPGVTRDSKYYVGFWESEKLVAILDLILRYPDQETAFVGLFMMDQSKQGRGIGSNIISEICSCLHREGYTCVRLAYVKGNGQSKMFWLKNQFEPTGEEYSNETYTAVVLQRLL